MFSLLIAIRNFTIAVLLAWMGFSIAPDSDEKKDSNTVAPSSGGASFFIG